MLKLPAEIKTCLGHAEVSNFGSLASSFLFSMSYTECLKDIMLLCTRKTRPTHDRRKAIASCSRPQ